VLLHSEALRERADRWGRKTRRKLWGVEVMRETTCIVGVGDDVTEIFDCESSQIVPNFACGLHRLAT